MDVKWEKEMWFIWKMGKLIFGFYAYDFLLVKEVISALDRLIFYVFSFLYITIINKLLTIMLQVI